MKDYLKEYEEALNNIIKPVMEGWDDYDLGSGDDDDADTGFTRESMFIQLGRIIDSQGNPNPVQSVTTDDGDEHRVSLEQAKVLRMLATTDQVKPMIRDRFLKDIQTTAGLTDFLEAGSPREMPKIFVSKYMGK